jgi:hypothetical protein
VGHITSWLIVYDSIFERGLFEFTAHFKKSLSFRLLQFTLWVIRRTTVIWTESTHTRSNKKKGEGRNQCQLELISYRLIGPSSWFIAVERYLRRWSGRPSLSLFRRMWVARRWMPLGRLLLLQCSFALLMVVLVVEVRFSVAAGYSTLFVLSLALLDRSPPLVSPRV